MARAGERTHTTYSAVFNPFLWKFSAISCGTNSGVGLELRDSLTAFYFLTLPNLKTEEQRNLDPIHIIFCCIER